MTRSLENKIKTKLVSTLSKACGWDGMVEGQILDISDHDPLCDPLGNLEIAFGSGTLLGP